MTEAYVIKDINSGEYITSSKSLKIDRTQRIYAKVYYSLSAAKRAQRWYQELYDYWDNTTATLKQKFPQEYGDHELHNKVWQIIEAE